MHPRDEELHGKRTASLPVTAGQEDDPLYDWYVVHCTENTDHCPFDAEIMDFIVRYARRAMESGGITLKYVEEFRVEGLRLLSSIQCDEIRDIGFRVTFGTKGFRGRITIPCTLNGPLLWSFRIGEGVGIPENEDER